MPAAPPPRTPSSGVPRYRVMVLPWLRRPMSRFVLDNWTAITIWRWIFSWRPMDEPELAHEVAHVAQWNRHGLLYPFRYFAASREAAKNGGDRYWDNAFEKEAREAADEVRRKLEEKSA